MSALRVLCLDIEGGFGGSSRSLFEALRHMPRGQIAAEIWCRRDGPIGARYRDIGLPCRVMPDMPRMNSLPRVSRNILGYSRAFWSLSCGRQFRASLLSAMERFDVVHFNHEGLFLLAAWLRRRDAKAHSMHVRTMIPRNAFGRWQCRRMAAAADRMVFITENERANVEAMIGRPVKGSVIYNAVTSAPAPGAPPHPAVPRDARLKIAALANYAWIRGIDRLVAVAEILAGRGRRDLLFVVAGDMALRGKLPGELGQIARRNGSLADHAAARGVADMFLFLGHVSEPEQVLAACDVLAKPTREDNPWGRDILEGLAAGKPVVTIGTYNRFVETGTTGFLLASYTDTDFAQALLTLDADRDLGRRMGEHARARVATLCSGPRRAAELAALWREAADARAARMAA